MKIELDVKGNFVEITNIRFQKKVADIVLGIQRGIDVYFRFETQMNKLLMNERCLHFTGPHLTVWDEKKCLDEVLKVLNSGQIIKTKMNYPQKENEF